MIGTPLTLRWPRVMFLLMETQWALHSSLLTRVTCHVSRVELQR